MDLKQIKSLLNLIAESGVNEVYIEEGDFKIRVKKTSDVVQHVTSAPHQYAPVATPALEVNSAAAPSVPSAPVPSAGAPSKSNTSTIKSPIVGTFYAAPSPDAKPFISAGDTIVKGAPLCIIEAMKIMNEIESEVSGKITKVLVKNGQPVEFDQPLFEIELA